MKLDVLEQAVHASNTITAWGRQITFRLELVRRGFSPDDARTLQQLHDDGQLHVLLDLKRAEHHISRALARITPQTAYLQEELDQQLCAMQVLLQKVEKEEALRRDRDVLLSPVPIPDAPPSTEGVLSWIAGQTTGSADEFGTGD